MAEIQAAKTLLSEEPKISVAFKNLISVSLGNQVTLHPLNQADESERLTSAQMLVILKTLTGLINSFVFTPPTEYFNLEGNEQKENQTGIDRMDEIAAYKVKYVVWKTLKDKTDKSYSVAKRTGKTMFDFVFPSLKPKLIQELSDSIPPALIESFLEPLNSPDLTDLSSLVWAVDFNAVLRKRQEQRIKNAEERTGPSVQEIS